MINGIEINKKNEITWFSGSGNPFNFNDIVEDIRVNISNGIEIHVGSDSDPNGENFAFVTGIALVFPGSGGRYYWYRKRINSKKFPNLTTRLQTEVLHSLNTAAELKNEFPLQDIRIHVDCSPDPKTASGKFAPQLKAYASCSGFSVYIKPLSWAASSLADKHAKKAFTPK